jgi:hypothetical protein
VCRNGECAQYDGYDLKGGTLLEAKGPGYDQWFEKNLEPKRYYKGLDGLEDQGRRQSPVWLEGRVFAGSWPSPTWSPSSRSC